MKISAFTALAVGLAISSAGPAAAAAKVAVWLDGNTDASGGGNTILTSLNHTFGAGYYQLVTTANLETAGFLNSFSTVIVSRYDHGFGTGLSSAAAANVQAYVGSGATQGGVALFTNDAADDFYGADQDPYVPDLDRLFTNAVTFAVQSGHGYIGEFNGAAMAVTSNGNSFNALGLLQGTAGALGGTSSSFVYDVGPIGGSNPIDAGVTFPLNDSESSTFLTQITGANPGNIVDVYKTSDANSINGLPAILANNYVISGGNPPPVSGAPEPSSWLLMLSGVAALGGWLRRSRNLVRRGAAVA